MTSQFWKWLSRANARTALLTAAVALAGSLAYWVWREVEPGQMTSAFPGRLADAEPGLTNRVELLAFIQAQQKNGEKAMNNPFFRKAAWKPETNPPKVQTRPEWNSANPSGNRHEVKPETQSQPKPPPPPPPKMIPVLFRGIMTRPDGAVMALIENQETKKQRFFEAGQTFMGRTIEQLVAESVVLKRDDGSEQVLPRGTVVRVREE